MAVLNIQFTFPSNGQQVVFPADASGNIDKPLSAAAGLKLQALARQIDDNALVTIPVTPVPADFPFPFFFDLPSAECPDVNTWYMLTVYAWDTDGDCTVQSVTFKRVAGSGGGLLGPPRNPPP